MAITAALVTALGGGKIDYIPLTPNERVFTVELPAGTWLVQVEAENSSSSPKTATLSGAKATIQASGSCLVTRIAKGGTLTGKGGLSVTFTHGIAIRLGD